MNRSEIRMNAQVCLQPGSVTLTCVKHRILNLLAAVSMLLFMATICSLIFGGITVSWGNPVRSAEYILDFHGSIAIQRLTDFIPVPSTDHASVGYFYPIWWESFGLRFDRRFIVRRANGSITPMAGTFGLTTEITAYVWWPLFLSVVLPAWMLIRNLRSRAMQSRKRAQLGLCPVCGYDLRATPQRCPECGKVP